VFCISFCSLSFGHCIVYPFVLFLSAIVLYVLFRFTIFYYLFGIFKLFIELNLFPKKYPEVNSCPILIVFFYQQKQKSV
jgi:hypothetical protein